MGFRGRGPPKRILFIKNRQVLNSYFKNKKKSNVTLSQNEILTNQNPAVPQTEWDVASIGQKNRNQRLNKNKL